MANEQAVNQTEVQGYGYENDEVKQSTMHFGGNFGNTFMTKFEHTMKAGKKGEDGQPTDGEALDIVFNINGTEKSYRMFPVTKAFDENNQEVTDRTHPAFIAAQKNFNQVVVQILKCYVDENDVKAALAKRIESFKDFCAIVTGLLPKNFATRTLDIFLQWQWSIGSDNDKTYLEIPKKVSYGRFVCAAVPATKTGEWKEVKTEEELFYIDGEPTIESGKKVYNKHPYFSRSKWFVESKFMTQQKEGSETTNALNNTNTGSTPSAGGASW